MKPVMKRGAALLAIIGVAFTVSASRERPCGWLCDPRRSEPNLPTICN